MDSAIRAAYQAPRRGINKALARRFDLNPRAISERASRLGLPPLIAQAIHRRRPMAWKAEEIDLVARSLNHSILEIRAWLARAGHYRSEGAIRSLIARKRAQGEWPPFAEMTLDRDQYLLEHIAVGLGIARWTLQRWANKGLLRAERSRGDLQWVVSLSALRDFLITNPTLWDHRKADRWFLIDVFSVPSAKKSRSSTCSQPMRHSQ
jgi:hypothetical protein